LPWIFFYNRIPFASQPALPICDRPVHPHQQLRCVAIRPIRWKCSASPGGSGKARVVARAAMSATNAIFIDEPTANLGVKQTNEASPARFDITTAMIFPGRWL
jgi:hypothetical protein